MRPFAVLAALGALVLTASWASTATSAPSATCPSALVLMTRGTNSSKGAPSLAFLARMKQLVSGARGWSNPYPATGVFKWNWPAVVAQIRAGKKPSTLDSGAYHASVVNGTQRLAAEISAEVQACGTETALLLLGYSQGAEITGNVVQHDLTAAERAAVTAVVLFGDPLYDGGDRTTDRGGSRNGLLGRRAPFVASKTSPVRSYCHAHDPICQGLFQGTKLDRATRTLAQHENYTKYQEPQKAAEAIARLPAFRLPDSIAGAWSGPALQSDGTSFTIQITLQRPVAGTAGAEALPEGGCNGTLAYKGKSGGAVRLQVHWTSGLCTDGLDTLTPKSDGSLQYHWDGVSGGQPFHADGVLNRT